MPENKSSSVALIVAWLVVGLPAAWGVEQTVYKSLDLFRTPEAHATAAPATQPFPTTAPTTQPMER